MLFGLGGMLLAVFVMAPLCLVPVPAVRHRAAQWVISRAFRSFLAIVALLGTGRVTLTGSEWLAGPGPRLVLANHPCLLDVVVLLSRMPQAVCVVKEGVWRNPFLWASVRAAGYISNRDPEALMDDCVNALRAGNTLILFPEGTRSRPGQAMRFQRGAARIALESGAPVQFVTMTCDPPTLMKNTKWHEIPERKWHIRASVDEPCSMEGVLDSSLPAPIAAKRGTDALKQIFEDKLNQHAELFERNS